MSEKNIHAFQPVMAMYRGKQEGARVIGIVMMVGLSIGVCTEALILNSRGVAIRIGAHMRNEGVEDWTLELNPIEVNAYLEKLQQTDQLRILADTGQHLVDREQAARDEAEDA